MNTLVCDKFGYGIEQEGWIVGLDGKPMTTIAGRSAYLMVRDEVAQITGAEPGWLSAELLSCQAEVKTEYVHATAKEALDEIKEHIATLKRAMQRLHSSLGFETVAYKDMRGVELVAADPNAPSYKRVQEWSSTEHGRELLRKTAICSTQLCVSDGLQGLSIEDKLRMLSQNYAYLTANYPWIQEINGYSPRLGIIEDLIISVKRDNFMQAGLIGPNAHDSTWITRPDGTDLQAWYMAHSGAKTLAEMDSKDAHGLLMKGKMRPTTMDLVCMEHRWADAQADLDFVLSQLMLVHRRMMDNVRI